MGGVGGTSAGAWEEESSKEGTGFSEDEELLEVGPEAGMKTLPRGEVDNVKVSSEDALRYSGTSTNGGAGLEGMGQSMYQLKGSGRFGAGSPLPLM